MKNQICGITYEATIKQAEPLTENQLHAMPIKEGKPLTLSQIDTITREIVPEIVKSFCEVKMIYRQHSKGLRSKL